MENENNINDEEAKQEDWTSCAPDSGSALAGVRFMTSVFLCFVGLAIVVYCSAYETSSGVTMNGERVQFTTPVYDLWMTAGIAVTVVGVLVRLIPIRR